MRSFICLLAAISSAPAVFGHATFQELWVAGLDENTSCARSPKSNSPITDVASKDIACNTGGSTGVADVCGIQAGDKISLEMHQQPNKRACTEQAIGGNHFGPVMVYMSRVSDAKTADGSSEFFKVGQFGYDAANKTWGTDLINQNCGKFDVTVPASLAPGDYLIRAEAIALHTASQVNGAQFYMTCYQVRVSSTGSASPAGVKFPGAYKATDPGIKVDIWSQDFQDYVIPGPELAQF